MGNSGRAGWRGRSIVGIVMGTGWLASMLAASAVHAGDLDNEPVSFRINLALDRSSSFTDTLGRTASVAYPLGSSINPAGYDFLREPPFDFKNIVTASSNTVFFNHSGAVTGFSVNMAHRFDGAGTLSGVYIRTDSHEADSRQGDAFALRSNQFILAYSHRLQQDLSVGGSVKVTDSMLGIDDTFMGFPRDTNTESTGVDFNLGVLKALSSDWTVGVVGGFGWTGSDTDAVMHFPGPPFGPGSIRADVSDTTFSSNVRVGLGWKPSQNLGFYADGQYLHLDNDLGSVDVGRLLAGAEFFPRPWLALRAGGSLDTDSNTGVSAGIGVYPSRNVMLEFAYVYNAFPEVNREFGRAHMVSASVIIRF